MPSVISNLAAAPPSAPTAAASSPSFSHTSSFTFSSYSSSSFSFSSSSPSSSFSSMLSSPPPSSSTSTHLDALLDGRGFPWPSASAWPGSYGGGDIYSYYCPPGVSHFGCRTSVPASTPVASATAVPPPPPVPTSAEQESTVASVPAVSTASTTLMVTQTSVASTTETITSPATDRGSRDPSPTSGGSPATTLLTMSAVTTSHVPLPSPSGSASTPSSSNLTNRTTVVVLSSVLSVVGILAVAGLVFVFCRYRQRRGGSFFPRGISPIDDDEIETWKGNRIPPRMSEAEKGPSGLLGAPAGGNYGPDSPPLLSAGALGAGATVQRRDDLPRTRTRTRSYQERGVSLDSSGITVGSGVQSIPLPLQKKAPSNVIIYKDPPQLYPGMPNLASSTAGFPQISGMAAPAATAADALVGTAAANYLQHQQQQQQQQQQSVPLYRRSEEISPRSARSLSFGYPASRGMAGRFSFDQDRDFLFSQTLTSPLTPLTALQHARAPNSRAGLTDEAIPGDPSFLPTPKRQPSRLAKIPPAMGSPSATAAATAAAVTGGAGPIFSPRRNSHSASGSGQQPNFPSPPGNGNGNSNSAAYWHARTRSARSCSTVSYAGSEVALNQSFGQPSHQRRPSLPQYQPMFQPQALTPPQQSPASTLHQQLPVPPLPVSTRTGGSGSNGGSDNISRRSSHSTYHEYLHGEQQPRDKIMSSSSTLASSSSSSIPPQMFSSGTAVMASPDDSDGPLLSGLSPPRPRMRDGPRIVHERSSSLEHLESIGQAIG